MSSTAQVEVMMGGGEVEVVEVLKSGWLSSIDNKVTFPWEAAWRSRCCLLSRAAGPLPLRGETMEGHQPAEGGRRRRSKHRLN